MSVIELKNITKTYIGKNGQVDALKDVSLSVEEGEIYGVIGLSGAGKSTLVRCINLLERPESGAAEHSHDLPAFQSADAENRA